LAQKVENFDHPASHCAVSCAGRARDPTRSDQISSSCSRSIEGFPELRQRCGTYDFPAPSLINAAIIA